MLVGFSVFLTLANKLYFSGILKHSEISKTSVFER